MEFQRLSQVIPVRPETAFHTAMLESAAQLESPSGWPSKDEREPSETVAGASFVAGAIREQVAGMIRSGRQIPEEALSFAAMTRLLTV